MINELAESNGAVLGFEVTGKVSLEDEKKAIERVNKVLEEHDKVSILVVLSEKAGFGVKAGIEDLKWLIRHMTKLNRIAVVSESHVWQWLVALDSPFASLVGISEKHFQTSQIDEAWAWIKE